MKLPDYFIAKIPELLKGLIHRYIGLILLLVVFCIGLMTYDDYGVNWDDPFQHQTGVVNYNYIFEDNQELLTYVDKDYGVAYELPLVLIEKVFELKDSRQIFLFRHLFSHIYFLLCAYCLFLLIDRLYKSKLLASIGFLLLVMCPRIYAHSFYNTKDLPFMGTYIICFYLAAKAFESKKLLHFLLLGVAAGVLINLRIMGVLFLLIALSFLVVDGFSQKEKSARYHLFLILILLASSLLTAFIAWPHLWTDPVNNFVSAFNNMAKFRWDSSVLLFGKYMKSLDLRWYYSITWFLITVPLLFLAVGFSGLITLVVQIFKKPLGFISNSKERNNLFYLATFVAPFFAIIFLKSVVYDGWRHIYFIYPAFIMMGIYGLYYAFQSKFKPALIVIIITGFGWILYYMIDIAPFQQVYFNKIANNGKEEYLRKNFEFDYWGLSYKQALEYVMNHDKRPEVKIAFENLPGEFNTFILKEKDRVRIRRVNKEVAEYFITNYRWHPQDYPEYELHKWHSIKVMNSSIVTIYKLK